MSSFAWWRKGTELYMNFLSEEQLDEFLEKNQVLDEHQRRLKDKGIDPWAYKKMTREEQWAEIDRVYS